VDELNLAEPDGWAGERVPAATVTIAGVEHHASKTESVVFGRADAPGLIGLDQRDGGVSATAGSVEWRGVWFAVKRSLKQKQHIDERFGGPQPRDCGQCHTVNVASRRIRVDGKISSHSIGVRVAEADLPRSVGATVSTGTTLDGIRLTADDRQTAERLASS